MKQLIAVVLFVLVTIFLQSLPAQTADVITKKTTIIDVESLAREINLPYWTEAAGKSSFTTPQAVDVVFRKTKRERREFPAIAEKAKRLIAGANEPTREWLNDLIMLVDQIQAKDAIGIQKTVIKLNDGLKTIALYNN